MIRDIIILFCGWLIVYGFYLLGGESFNMFEWDEDAIVGFCFSLSAVNLVFVQYHQIKSK